MSVFDVILFLVVFFGLLVLVGFLVVILKVIIKLLDYLNEVMVKIV